jgi:hypothetical protein
MDKLAWMQDALQQTPWPARWLRLSVLALALSGIFSIVLVISRTPQLIAMFPWIGDLFSVSLVIHVDLSVLIWFLSMSLMLWSMLGAGRTVMPYAQATAWWAMLAGMLLMALSPLNGEWSVIKSNYVPVIENQLFFFGLALAFGSLIVAMLAWLPLMPRSDAPATQWGIYISMLITAGACAAFAGSYSGLEGISGHGFYENLFWGGGHLLQFTYMQALLIAWCVLARALGIALPSRRVLHGLFLTGLLAAVPAVWPYAVYPVASQELMDFFTNQMIIGLGIASSLLAVWLVVQWLRGGSAEALPPVKAALRMSLLLFMVGGVFGLAINGPNVRIPAHYHGSIVAVTLALMGMAYRFLPLMGMADVSQWRMAKWQPYLYGFGQLLHITGLAASGGYGVLRKAVGDTGDGSWQVKMWLGIMGGGGLLAIIGGLLFVIVMIKAFRRKAIA